MSDVRLSCRCYATPREDGAGWLVTAAAFLCPDNHRSGDTVTREDEALRRRSEEDFDRAERDHLEQSI